MHRAPPAATALAARRAVASVVVLALIWAASFNLTSLPFFPTVLVGAVASGAAGWWVRAALPDPPPLLASPSALAVGALVGGAQFVVGIAALRLAAVIAPGLIGSSDAIYDRIDHIPLGWQLLLAAAVTAPLEEVFWRGAMQPLVAARLPAAGTVSVVGTAAVVYSLFHAVTLAVPLVAAAALGGVVWGALLERTGTVGAPAASHAVWTGLMVAVAPALL